jgi:hypothetical protein
MNYNGRMGQRWRRYRGRAIQALGRPLRGGQGGEQVHHWEPGNDDGPLVVCPDTAYHRLLHIRTAALEACGNPDWRHCVRCKQYDDPANMSSAPGRAHWTTHFYHRACEAARGRERKARLRQAKAGLCVLL